jgi:nucleotide-binding universal stress UspA family protein
MPEANGLSTIPTKILVPVDFSPSSHAALEAAAELAQHFGAEIYLVHVIPMFPTTTIPDFFPETKFLEESRKVAEGHFAKCKSDLGAKGIKVSSSIETGDDVAGNILDVAEREHADLIVVSTHGLTGWHPLVFGSIAEKVLKLAHSPVLLLRTPKPESSAKVKSERMMEWW